MTGFSAQWLALREPVDHRSINPDVRAAFVEYMRERGDAVIMDIGCGTGSHLRALAPHLGERQSWRLVDYDSALLQAAREALAAWADESMDAAGTLRLRKDGKSIEVAFHQADLATGLEAVLDLESGAVTASAFFDLVSRDWISRFCEGLAARKLPLYTVLTYDGRESWTPPHPADAQVLEAFHAHQASDKGFGPAAGPAAGFALVEALRRHRYWPEIGPSPWRLDASDGALMAELAKGSAQAAAETGLITAQELAAWRESRLAAETCMIGHTDLFAAPE